MIRKTAVISALSAAVLAIGLASASASAAPHPVLAEPAVHSNGSSLPVQYAGVLMKWKGGEDWMGSYDVPGEGIADCVTPLLNLVTPTTVVKGIYGSTRQSAEISYVMDNWGTSSSGSVAAGARVAMLEVLNRLGEYPGLKIPSAIAVFAKNDLHNANLYAGPDTAHIAFLSKPATPGQPGAAAFDIVSGTGHAVNGIASLISATGAVIGSASRSGTADGFTRTSPVSVGVSGSAQVSSDKVVIGTSGQRATQTLIGAVSSSVSASASYASHGAGVRSSVKCNCDGTGDTTAVFSQAAGAAEGKYVQYANGTVDGSVTIPVSKHGDTATLKVSNVPAGALVTFTASYLVNGEWTAPVALGGTYRVNCPVLPEVAFTAQCNCASGASSTEAGINVTDPSASFTDVLTYTTPDGLTHTVSIPAGGSKSVSFTVPGGKSVSYSTTVYQGGHLVASGPAGLWS